MARELHDDAAQLLASLYAGLRAVQDAGSLAGRRAHRGGRPEPPRPCARQEALTNAVKRSGATTIGVVLVQTEKRVQLVVEDNGRGFEPIPPVTHGHLGR